MKIDEILRMRQGDLFYWNRHVVEFIGQDKKGKFVFETTNGGNLVLSLADVKRTITNQ